MGSDANDLQFDDFEWECVLGKGGFGFVKAAVKRVRESYHRTLLAPDISLLLDCSSIEGHTRMVCHKSYKQNTFTEETQWGESRLQRSKWFVM